MKIGVVTVTSPDTCKVRVQFRDQDGMVSDWLPVMQKKSLRDKSYWMPDLGEHVVCMLDENEEFGVVLGAIYSDADSPPVSSQDKYHIAFDDGTTIEYDRLAHKLKADVQGDIEVTATGDMTADITGDTTLTTPTFTINANVIINGQLTQGRGDAGGWAKLLGPIEVINDVTAEGVSLAHHIHNGVQTGGGNTGQPVHG